jgi:hypothetical protein
MRRPVIAFYRIGLGALVLTALVIQFVVSFRAAPFPPLNYFSYFTNLANLYGALIFLYCGFGRSDSLRISKARGAAVVYLAITGIVYGALLINEPLGLLLPWVNVLLHYIMPIVFVGDWLIDPPRSGCSPRSRSGRLGGLGLYSPARIAPLLVSAQQRSGQRPGVPLAEQRCGFRESNSETNRGDEAQA